MMASQVVKVAPFSLTIGRPSFGKRTVVTCKAVDNSASRRDVFIATAVTFSSLLPFINQPALALLPDDEDEDLVSKAKANRRTRLIEQRGTTQQFMQSEGLRDAKLESSLTSVQRAVVKLSQSGSQLEQGDLRAVNSMLSESWVTEFDVASKKLPGGGGALEAVSSNIQGLREATGRSDAAGSRKSFVALVASLKSWTASAGIQQQLQGL